MKQPRRTKRWKTDGLTWTARIVAIITLIALGLTAAQGCEPAPIKLQSMPTTMPTLRGENLEAIAAQRRADARLELDAYIVEMRFLAEDYRIWHEQSCEANAKMVSALCLGDKARIAELAKASQKLAETGDKLDGKSHALRLMLSEMQLDDARFNETRPNLLLLAEEKK